MDLSKDTIKRGLDAAAIAALGAVLVSGAILHNVVPSGDRFLGFHPSEITPALFGLSVGAWIGLHDVVSVIFIILLIPNLYWGWAFISGLLRPDRPSQLAPRALAGVFAALAAVIWLFGGTDIDLEGELPPPIHAVPLLGQHSDARIRALTLEDIQRRLDIPVDYMRSNLGLPAGVSTTVPLGELMTTYNFTTSDVRGVLLMCQIQTEMPNPQPQRN